MHFPFYCSPALWERTMNSHLIHWLVEEAAKWEKTNKKNFFMHAFPATHKNIVSISTKVLMAHCTDRINLTKQLVLWKIVRTNKHKSLFVLADTLPAHVLAALYPFRLTIARSYDTRRYKLVHLLFLFFGTKFMLVCSYINHSFCLYRRRAVCFMLGNDKTEKFSKENSHVLCAYTIQFGK